MQKFSLVIGQFSDTSSTHRFLSKTFFGYIYYAVVTERLRTKVSTNSLKNSERLCERKREKMHKIAYKKQGKKRERRTRKGYHQDPRASAELS